MGAQDVAEAYRHELGVLSRDGGNHNLRQPFGSAHHVGGVHRLVRGNQDKAFDVAFHSHLRRLVGAEDVVQDGLLAAGFHQGNMLVGRRVDHDIRLILAHHPPEGFLVPDAADFQHQGVGYQFAVFLLQFEEEIIHIVFGNIVKDQLLRGKGHDLAAQLGTDASASAGNEYGLAGQEGVYFGHIQVLFRPAQQVSDVDFPGFRPFPYAGVDHHMGAGSDAVVQESGNLSLGRRDGDDDLINIVLIGRLRHGIRAADNRNSRNGGMLPGRIVVQDGHGSRVSVTAVLDIPDHGCSGIAGADDQDTFGFLVLFPAAARGLVTDQVAGGRHQEEGDHPLDEIDRAGHQEDVRADLVPEKIEDQGNQVGDTCSRQGADAALDQDVLSGIGQDLAVNPAEPQGRQGGDQQDRKGSPEMNHVAFRNTEGEIEFHRYKQADKHKQRVHHRPQGFLQSSDKRSPLCRAVRHMMREFSARLWVQQVKNRWLRRAVR